MEKWQNYAETGVRLPKPVFLIFCADYYCTAIACRQHGQSLDQVLNDIDHLIISGNEVSITLRTAVIAAGLQGLATVPLSYCNIPMSYISEIQRPILIVAGEKAHFRYMSEDAFKNAGNNPNKELVIVEGATHVDLYDNVAGKIPCDKFEQFSKANLK